MKPFNISPLAALRLVELIREQAKVADSKEVQKILLRAGIKIADLVLDQQQTVEHLRKAA